ncbi:NAD(P)/FAD-dependent oxidoreductase [bacterium]|nr:NAD(P)/FAD-dependent oxidoreductase [bacterium]MBU1883262.1 NAD(P)/FAD-dependent oxidoreductase [bacterium]
MENIVIIGAGLGGLSAGALLAKEGYRVTILEQHGMVGGCATVFKRKGGFTCEVGLHEMDGVYTSPVIKKVFERLGVYENVEFVKPDEFFKVSTKYGEFVMPDGKIEAITALKSRFPHEQKGIENYFQAIGDIAGCYKKLVDLKWSDYLLFPILFYPILKYKNKNTAEVLNGFMDDEELKLILNTNVQYYNDTPDTLSFLLHAVAQNSYYEGGGWFIKGGSYCLSEYLASLITCNGGNVITKADVVKATKESVTYRYKNEEVTIQADKIISDISPQDTYRLFDMEFTEQKQIAESIITVYLGFSKSLRELYPDGAYSNFLLDSFGSQDDFKAMAKQDVTTKDFVFVDYSRIDSGLTSDEKSFGAVCVLDEIQSWESLDAEAYKQKKERLLEHVLERLEKHYPKIKELVEYAEVATPKTMQRYVRTPKGTAYGYKPTPQQFFRKPKIRSDKIDNLYFVGQFVLAGGFSPAISSGSMCFDTIVKGK